MPDPISGVAVYLIPGMSVKLTSSLSNRNNFGYFAAKSVPEGYFGDMTYVSDPPLNGFVVEDKRNGVLSTIDEQGSVVIYTHKRVAPNAIWYFAISGERGLVNVISVPIHDHSTIVHGGPAYGTYFDDDVER